MPLGVRVRPSATRAAYAGARELAIPSKWPVDGFISSGFGYRAAPISGRWTFHSGIDIAARHGTTIFAQNNGVVVVSEYQSGYGNFIEIDHGYGIRTRYGHASNQRVLAGAGPPDSRAV